MAIRYLGYTPGLFIVGLFAILILWMYANFWITGTLLIVGGMARFLLPRTCDFIVKDVNLIRTGASYCLPLDNC